MKTEAKVGLFITISLFFLFGLLSQLNSFDNFFKKSYPIMAKVSDGSGLKDKAKVKFKGVDIGYVEAITLDKHDVITHLLIDEGIVVPSDSIIMVSQDSLLGGKFLDIKPGVSTQALAPNQLLSNQEEVSSISDASTSADKAFQEIGLLVGDLRDIFNSGGKSDIQATLANLREFTELLASLNREDNETIHQIITNLNEGITHFSTMSQDITGTSQEFGKVAKGINKDLPRIMAKLDSITKYLDNVSATLDAQLPTAMNKFVALEDNLNGVVTENRAGLKNALTSVDGFFAGGQETMQKVDKYLDSMIKSELHIEMRSDEVYDDGGYSKTHLNLALKPDATRYYILGVSSGPSFKSDASSSRGYIGNAKHESGDFLLSAQYGKRYDDMLFRIGVIEGQGGFGVDYFALNDTLKVSANVYDFNAVNDVRGTNANLTTTVRYQFFKHINAYVSANNVLNSKANSVSAGLGISFVDNDLKNLLGSAAAASN